MANEQEKTFGVLQTAIKMEIDGKQFYLKASQASGNILGRNLFTKLAQEEDVHRKVFERIYNTIRETHGWPKQKIRIDQGKSLKTVFAAALKEMDRNVKPMSTELDDIQTAMAMENKTYDYYTSHGNQASLPVEKEFYLALAGQEEEHHRNLLDYFEFMKNPAAYFVQKEHPSLDGG
jgi:rubrerythrin